MQAQQGPTSTNKRFKNCPQDLEARKSVLIAELTADFAKEEKEITSQFDSDPLLKLKSRELTYVQWKMNVKKWQTKPN